MFIVKKEKPYVSPQNQIDDILEPLRTLFIENIHIKICQQSIYLINELIVELQNSILIDNKAIITFSETKISYENQLRDIKKAIEFIN